MANEVGPAGDRDRSGTVTFLTGVIAATVAAALVAARETLDISDNQADAVNATAMAGTGVVIAVAILSSAWVVTTYVKRHAIQDDRLVTIPFLTANVGLVIAAALAASKEALVVTPGGPELINVASVAGSALVVAVAIFASAWVISATMHANPRVSLSDSLAICAPPQSMQVRLGDGDDR